MSAPKDFDKTVRIERTQSGVPEVSSAEGSNLGERSTQNERSMLEDAASTIAYPGEAASPLSAAGDSESLVSVFEDAGSSISDLDAGDFSSPEFEPSDLASRYTLESSLGKGGMGEVLLATDTRLKRKVAIKRVLASSTAALIRFQTEAQSIAAVNHFNIVQVYDYGQDKDGPYLIMEYVQGESLQERLQAGAIEPTEAIDMVCQLCDGLGFAHERGIIHRDIKPANILLTLNGDPKLTDFGLAKQDSGDRGLTVTGAVMGTLDYMPPEQRRDSSRVDARTDLWSLAATLYSMLSGKSPKVIRLDPIPKSLQSALSRALEENPEERFSSASELKKALLLARRGLEAGWVTQDLATGECPGCGATNEVTNNFCTTCTAPLTESCLNCKTEIKAWHSICGNCGTRQSDAISSERAKVDELLSQSKSLQHEYQLDEALALLGRYERLEHSALADTYAELDSAVAGLKAVQQEWHEKRESLVAEAQRLIDEFRWNESSRVFSSLPEPLWDDRVGRLLELAQSQQNRLMALGAEIKQRVKSKAYSGLREKVSKYLELRPSDEQAKKLLNQLAQRESDRSELNTLASNVRRFLERFQFDEALATIEQFRSANDRIPETRLQAFVDEVNTGRQVREDEKARILEDATSGDTHELLQAVETYERRYSDTESLAKVREALNESLQSERAEVIAQFLTECEELHRAGDYEQVIEKVKDFVYFEEDTDPRVQALLEQAQLALTGRERELQKILAAYNRGQHESLLPVIEKFETTYSDKFSLRAVRRGIERAVEAKASANRHRKRVVLGAVAAGVLLVIAVAGGITALRMRAVEKERARIAEQDRLATETRLAEEARAANRAKELRDALDAGDYAVALQLDPENEQALSMKKAAVIQQGLDTGDYATVLQLDPSNVEALALKQRAVEIQNALNAGDYTVALQLDPSNDQALAMKKKETDFQHALESGDYVTALKLFPGNARALALQKAAELQKALDAGDYVTALRLDPSNADALAMKKEAAEAITWHGWPADAPPPAIAPFNADEAKAYQEAWAKYLDIPVEYTNSIGMKFRLIPPGEFVMGSTPEEIAAALQVAGEDEVWKERINSEAPQHKVVLTQPVYIGMTEVTQWQYEQIMGANPSHFSATGEGKDAVANLETGSHPVEMVTWNDAAEFCAKLSQQEQLKPFYSRSGETITPLEGTGYRLPTEAEWESACRAGTTTRFWSGERQDLISAGWFGGNSGGRTHAAGELKANPFGLSDMHGNVWEWVQDNWDPAFYGKFEENAAIKPSSPFSAGSQRVLRGGIWLDTPSLCRSSRRGATLPAPRNNIIGFRVAMEIVDNTRVAKEQGSRPPVMEVPKGGVRLTRQVAERFVADPTAMELSKFSSLDDDAAEVLSKYGGDELGLEGLVSITEAAIDLLSKYEGVLNLEGLASLSDSQAESLAKCKGRGVRLNGLTAISDKQAEILSRHPGFLNLNGISEISESQVENLSQHRGVSLTLGLKSLTDAQAESLSKHDGCLVLNGLTELSDAQAEAFSKHKGVYLGFIGLTSISATALESLSGHRGSYLRLTGLTSLSDTQAQSLTKYQGKLILAGLDVLTDTTAESLSKCNCLSLHLNNLSSLSDAQAVSLSKVEGALVLYGLTFLSDIQAETLSQHEAELFVSYANLPPSAAKIIRESRDENNRRRKD